MVLRKCARNFKTFLKSCYVFFAVYVDIVTETSLSLTEISVLSTRNLARNLSTTFRDGFIFPMQAVTTHPIHISPDHIIGRNLTFNDNLSVNNCEACWDKETSRIFIHERVYNGKCSRINIANKEVLRLFKEIVKAFL